MIVRKERDWLKVIRNSGIIWILRGIDAINDVLLDTEQKFICVSRPRRFGKSMAVNIVVQIT